MLGTHLLSCSNNELPPCHLSQTPPSKQPWGSQSVPQFLCVIPQPKACVRVMTLRLVSALIALDQDELTRVKAEVLEGEFR